MSVEEKERTRNGLGMCFLSSRAQLGTEEPSTKEGHTTSCWGQVLPKRVFTSWAEAYGDSAPAWVQGHTATSFIPGYTEYILPPPLAILIYIWKVDSI